MKKPAKLDHITNANMTDTPVAFDFDPEGGMINNFVITAPSGQELRPLHTAPWASPPKEDFPDVSLVEQKLSGDFFCAPFGGNGDEPIHGKTANNKWLKDTQLDDNAQDTGTETGTGTSRSFSYKLEDAVNGAAVTKTFELHAGHPVLYQSHLFDGGVGHLPVGHHAMIHVPGGVTLSFSKKQLAGTPGEAPEPDPARGRSHFKYPQTVHESTQLKTLSDDTIDFATYPFAKGHEDLVIMAEQANVPLGWTAALAAQDGFLFFAIKDAIALPETLLWMSNGGRKYAPWLGRHRHVLGIEEVSTTCHHNGVFSSAPGLSPCGLGQGLELSNGKTSQINYAFGAITPPDGWTKITDIQIKATSLVLHDIGGETITVPFCGAHFGL